MNRDRFPTVLVVLVGAGVFATCGARDCAIARLCAQPALERADHDMPDGPAGLADVVGPLERALLRRVTLGDGGHVAHCTRAPGGCAARVHRIAVALATESARAGVDVWIVASIATLESGLDSGAVGRAGELGLLQVMPTGRAAQLAREWIAGGLHRGTALVRAGVWLLARCIRRYGVERGLSAYHTGRAEGSERGDAYARRVLRRRAALIADGGEW